MRSGYRRGSVEEVARRYLAGAYASEIARDLGLGRTTVTKYLAEAGVKTKVGLRPGPVRWTDPNGYVKIQLPHGANPLFDAMKDSTGRLREHRLVMAQHLGRPLRRHEAVHHIDGDRSNNSIENLEVWTRGHPQGIRLKCCDCGSHDVRPC